MKWTTSFARGFLKDLARIPAKQRGRIEEFVFQTLPASDNPLELGSIEKLKGYRAFYKVRFGDYRVGLMIDMKTKAISVLRVLHRKEIYRFFPK